MEVGLVVLWVGTFLGLGVAAFPFTAWLLPDTEYCAFAIPVALAVLAVVGHLVGHVAFGWPAVLAGLVVLISLSVFTFDRTDEPPDLGRAVETALVFVAGFVLVVIIRSFDPAAAPLPLSIGEKFLDFGLLNTLDRSSSLPPESMWFAGEPVKYYYGGHLLSSLLATLTATGTAYAYNLALAGFYATLVTAAYGLAASIAIPYGARRRVAGALGAFFVGIASNLETFVRLLAWQLPSGAAEWAVSTLGLADGVARWTPDRFHYFDASRVIPVEPHVPDSGFLAATEFPLFAWLNGDLHAHMMSQPFTLLAAAILLAAWRSPLNHRRILLVGFLPPLVGLVGFLNLWSLPTVLGLTALAIFFAPESPRQLLPETVRGPVESVDRPPGLRTEGIRLLLAAAITGVVLVGGIVWTLPFWTTVILGGPGQSIEYWGAWTPLGPFVVVFGAFLAAIGAYVARAIAGQYGMRRPGLVLVIGGTLVAITAVLGWPLLGLLVLLVLAGWWLLRTGDVGFETLLVVAGAGIVLLVEFVSIEGERFNVIFKPYVHVWLFWAIATAVILPRLAAGWPDLPSVDGEWFHTTGTVLLVVLVFVTVPYAAFALHGHVTDGTETTDAVGTTLDATAYLEVHYPEEAPAIRWLEDRSGQPTVLTAAPARYTWNSTAGDGAAAPSSLTGIPTVAGWSHEAQYRGRDIYDQRVQDVWQMYGGSPGEQRQLLAEYDVEYVYVGPAERNTFAFEVTVDELDAVSVAASWEHVVIYEVDQDRLGE